MISRTEKSTGKTMVAGNDRDAQDLQPRREMIATGRELVEAFAKDWATTELESSLTRLALLIDAAIANAVCNDRVLRPNSDAPNNRA